MEKIQPLAKKLKTKYKIRKITIKHRLGYAWVKVSGIRNWKQWSETDFLVRS